MSCFCLVGLISVRLTGPTRHIKTVHKDRVTGDSVLGLLEFRKGAETFQPGDVMAVQYQE